MSLNISTNLPLAGAIACGVALTFFCLVLRRWASGRSIRYPPGPKPLPFIGNILDLPKSEFALTWTKFGKEYGPLTWLTIPGRNFLVINSVEAAKDLLEKQGSNYINRPRFIMMGELVGFQEITPLNQYDSLWRAQRTLLKHALSGEVIQSDYATVLERTARKFVHCLSAGRGDFAADLIRVMQENIIELTYGRQQDDQGRDYVDLNTKVMDIGTRTMQGYLVDLIPALLNLPSWLPGMNFKRDAVKWRDEIGEVRRTTFECAKQSVLSGDASLRSSYVVKNLQALYSQNDGSINSQKIVENEAAICHSGFSFFMAGTDTTQTTARAFLLAMMLYPSVQAKVHEELDRVIGSDRPPTLEDLPNLPYLNAAVLETLRWNPVAPDGSSSSDSNVRKC
ncbi:hypothetical protein FRB90_009884 [Tulasnella sp. 427]|nr:hypothetical protein FRB90_009884 [Tulasnella sp. 427]